MNSDDDSRSPGNIRASLNDALDLISRYPRLALPVGSWSRYSAWRTWPKCGEKPGSLGWGAIFPHMVTWVKLASDAVRSRWIRFELSPVAPAILRIDRPA